MAAPISGMKLTFAEEFNSLKLGSTWKPTDQWGNRYLAGNKEEQLYVDPAYKGLGINPFDVTNGVLTIKSRQAGGNAAALGKQYTSGMISSHGAGGFSQQYGYFEMRAQLPQGKGMWPAFWLLADHGKWPPELDVMESIGQSPTYLVQSVHSKDGNKGKATYASQNLQTSFNTYGMNWTKDTITYYFNGQATATYATPSDMHTKMHMLLNTAVGGSWPGSPDSTTNWANANYKIDYVRVYSSDPNAKPAPSTPTPTPTPSNPTPTGTGHVVMSNKINALDLSDSYRAGYSGNNTTRTYAASQMAIAGVQSPTAVSVAYSSAKDITATNTGAWGGIKNASVKTSDVRNVTLRNFVDAQVAVGDTARTITVSDAKRGTITTGNGSDTITVSGRSDTNDINLMTINTGAGANKVSYTGGSLNRVRVNGGGGADTVTISGKAAATVIAGAGDDRVNISTTADSTVTGGTGRDVFSFLAGAHATVTDFKRGEDRVELRGISSSSVKVRTSGNSTLIDLGSSGRITIAGVATNASGLSLSYA
jgi:beta-glucanase (GH16 family)